MKKHLMAMALIGAVGAVNAADVVVPVGYSKYEGTWQSPMGNRGTLVLHVDNPANPSHIFILKSGGACAYNLTPLQVKKTDTGFLVETYFPGRCRDTTITFLGLNEKGGFTGSFSSFAGSSDMDVRPVK